MTDIDLSYLPPHVEKRVRAIMAADPEIAEQMRVQTEWQERSRQTYERFKALRDAVPDWHWVGNEQETLRHYGF